jgi:hypothetical protein
MEYTSINFQNFMEIIHSFVPYIVIGCESTYTYYWLADGCHQAGIPFYLGHALYMKAISKKKQKDDKIDARTIADMLRTSFFPEAYPYPREMRPTRDLWRRHRLDRMRGKAYSHIQMTKMILSWFLLKADSFPGLRNLVIVILTDIFINSCGMWRQPMRVRIVIAHVREQINLKKSICQTIFHAQLFHKNRHEYGAWKSFS